MDQRERSDPENRYVYWLEKIATDGSDRIDPVEVISYADYTWLSMIKN